MRQLNKILKKACVKGGTFHDFGRTAISMWFANGMSEHDVMVLAGHASFATTHKFYLAIADDLIHRARAAIVQGLRQKLVQMLFETKKRLTACAESCYIAAAWNFLGV